MQQQDEDPPRVSFPVNCPVCRQEVMAEYRHSDLLGALINHRPIRLYAPCHDTSWAASYVEVQQIRSRMGVTRLESSGRDGSETAPASRAGESSDD
jgi:hypothetical protein